MSLQFIMGPSGSGKSHYLYQKVTEEARKHPDKNYFVIVPDQFTMQTQRDLVMANPNKGILNVDVLSFHRLAYRIFEETGAGKQTILNDVGKNFVLRKVAADCEPELKLLGGNLKKTGFISELKSVFSEFMQYDVQAEDLEKLMRSVGEGTAFYHKLQDMKIIYQAFQSYLGESYITGEEILEELCRAVPRSALLKDSVLVLDGFTGFTPVQDKLLKLLLGVCEDVVVTVTVGRNQSKHPLFALSDKTMTSLRALAGEQGVTIKRPVELYQKPIYRFRDNGPLEFLESHLFRYSREKYEEEQDRIQIFSGKQPQDETGFVAQRIRNLVRTRGMRYREIAVIASDMNAYANHVERAFVAYDIPFFMDHKRSILLNSFVEYLRSLLAMTEQNFTYESVFRYLRTGLTGFQTDEIDILENYCVAMGIKGYGRWQETWIHAARGMSESDLAQVNAIRVRFLEGIAQVTQVLKKRSKTVEEITRALHDHFVEQELQQKVKGYERRFALAGELSLEKEYAQIYRIVMDLFDQLVELLGKEKISLRAYCELLDTGLEEAKIGIIPPSLDQVVVGDIERTRIQDVKVIFFLGVNDNHIPGNAAAKGLLSERDRERFSDAKITLAPSAKEKAFQQKFYLYLLLTKPSDGIVLSFSRAGADGKTLRPAYLVSDLLKMFPRLHVREIDERVNAAELTRETGVSYLVKGLQKKSEGLSGAWQELYSWYRKHPEWCRQIEQLLEATFYRKPTERLTRETAEQLYGNVLHNSVSRLEKFSACAYAHFLSYGLKLREREVYQFQALDTGNLLHKAMERYAKKLERENTSWTAVSVENQEALVAECVEEAISYLGNTVLYSSARNESMILRLKNLMKRSVWAITKQLETEAFVPRGFEVQYESDVIPLEDGHTMQTRGKIDRIDLGETEDCVRVKVIDYKTGKKVFHLGEVYHGLQMQLVVYLNEAMKQEKQKQPEKQVVPGGLYYFHIQNPLLAREDNQEAQEKAMLKAFSPQGLSGASLSEEDFSLVQSFAEHKMKEIGNEMMRGTIEISPYAKGQYTGCGLCPYHSVCGFDEKIDGYRYRIIENESAQDILAQMRKEAETWE